MATRKIITSVSLTPEGKQALIDIAKDEGKSITAVIEQLIRNRARAKKIALKPAQEQAS